MLKFLQYAICVLIVYIYIYSPILQSFPILLHAIVFLGAALYIFMFKRCSGRYISLYISLFKRELQLLFCIALFSALIAFVHHGFSLDIIAIYDLFLFLEVLFVPFVLVDFFQNSLKISLIYILIVNSLLAGSISVALLLNPAWAEIMKTQILLLPNTIVTYASFRCFGFSDGLTYAFPVVQGFCAGFIILGLIKRNLFFYFGMIPVLISILVNARTGIFPVLIAIGILLFFHPQKIFKTVLLFCVVLLLVAVFYDSKSETQFIESVEWGMSFFQVLSDFMSGEETGTMNDMAEMFVFPQSLSAWLIGEGSNIFMTTVKGYSHSDLGYCIRSVYGGIIYVGLWFSLCIFMFKRLIKFNKQIALLLFISLLFLNWKGDFFSLNAGSRLFFFVYACIIMDKNFLFNKRILFGGNNN